MNILIFHPVHLPPPGYGGVERVVMWLAKGLRERGNQVTVAALEGSTLPPGVTLLPMKPDAKSAKSIWGRLPKGLDLIHFMAPPTEEEVRGIDVPRVLTVHGNGQPGEKYPENSVFLSRDHAERHGGECFVFNGVDPVEFQFNPGAKGRHLLFLSKTSWSVKNLKGAMDLCTAAGVGLKIAGGGRPLHLRARALLTPGFSWCGSVSGAKKAELLSRARALIFPVKWPEPFGLAVIESLISGTPVFASSQGSLPELINPQVGVLCKTREEWLHALSTDGPQFSPEACRDWALRNFHYHRMTEGYEEVYSRVIGGKKLNSKQPAAKGRES
jgi:glycosyltransferase involved in cell wall biosynthesis